MRRLPTLALGLCSIAAVALLASRARAADHLDGPVVEAEPAADITDLFSWMSADTARVYLVMDVFPEASASSRFSDAVQYVFHTNSQATYGGTPSAELPVICTFTAAQVVSCWAGSSYVTGDASATAGLTSADGKLKVFAGLRDDPFFFNLDGFKATATAVKNAKGSLTFDAAGCPALDTATATALATQLRTEPDGGTAQDFFATFNVLALTVSVDKSLLTGSGPIVSVWASTNRAH